MPPGLKAEPPCWGYRRIWAYLRVVEPVLVNQQRMRRLMREPPLLVPPHLGRQVITIVAA
jgi:putative transposase